MLKPCGSYEIWTEHYMRAEGKYLAPSPIQGPSIKWRHCAGDLIWIKQICHSGISSQPLRKQSKNHQDQARKAIQQATKLSHMSPSSCCST